MYADRYAGSKRISPASLGIAVGINAALVAGLLFANPDVIQRLTKPPLTVVKPIDLPKTQAPPRTPPLIAPDTIVRTQPTTDFVIAPLPPQPPVETIGTGTGSGGVVVEPVRLPPVLTQPGVDPRYAGLFQPPYPPAEQRAGRTGRVEVRVLVGVDGRVKQVERVLATSDDFFRVTEQRALAKWRFTPATRDGIPVEAWRSMTVRFELDTD
jgi:protein TonB